MKGKRGDNREMNKRIYLDNAATTPVRPEAAQAALEAMTEGWGNPSSVYALGARAAADLGKLVNVFNIPFIVVSAQLQSQLFRVLAIPVPDHQKLIPQIDLVHIF